MSIPEVISPLVKTSLVPLNLSPKSNLISFGSNNSTKFLKALLEVHFSRDGGVQAPPSEELQQIPFVAVWQFAKSIVTNDTISWVVNEFSPYKSVRPDEKGPSLDATNLALGYVPLAWRFVKLLSLHSQSGNERLHGSPLTYF